MNLLNLLIELNVLVNLLFRDVCHPGQVGWLTTADILNPIQLIDMDQNIAHLNTSLVPS